MHPSDHNFAYVDERYGDLNPQYHLPQVQQIWGLGRPFPRVVRPGMLRKIEEDQKKEKRDRKKAEREGGEEKGEEGLDREPLPDGQSALSGTGDFGQGPPGGPARWAEEERERERREKEMEEDDKQAPRRNEEDEYEDEPDEEITEYLNKWCKIRFRYRELLAEWLAVRLLPVLSTCFYKEIPPYTPWRGPKSFFSSGPLFGYKTHELHRNDHGESFRKLVEIISQRSPLYITS